MDVGTGLVHHMYIHEVVQQETSEMKPYVQGGFRNTLYDEKA